jgi:hypothetical protein
MLASIKHRAAIAAVVLSGVAGVAAPSAQASAVGCTWFGTYVVGGHTIYAGQYCFGINGSGTWVNFTDGSVNTPAIYNRSEVVRFYDRYGNLYAAFYEPEAYGYTYGFHYWQTGIHGWAKAGGRVCGTLTSSGAGVATACEGIS